MLCRAPSGQPALAAAAANRSRFGFGELTNQMGGTVRKVFAPAFVAAIQNDIFFKITAVSGKECLQNGAWKAKIIVDLVGTSTESCF